jgi:hypothetical protein
MSNNVTSKAIKAYLGVDNPKLVKESIPFQESTIETVDFALYNYINEKLNIFTNTNEGWKKVPILWMSAERVFQIKNDIDLRDAAGALKFPLITIERTGVTKDLSKKGSIWANIPPTNDEQGGSITIARKIKQDKSTDFAVAGVSRAFNNTHINFPMRNKKVVYETLSIPIPVYLDMSYKLTFRTEYQEQMNDMLTPFATRTGGVNHFMISRDGHRYEAFIQSDFSFANNIANMNEEERIYQTSLEIKVLGYIVGEGKNQEKPRIVKRQNAVEVRLGKEQIILGNTAWKDPAAGRTPGLLGHGSFAGFGSGEPADGVVTAITASTSGSTTTITLTRSKDLASLSASFLGGGSQTIAENTVTREVPTGLINGSNTVYTVTNNIYLDTETVFVNGILQQIGASFDYTVTGDKEVTFNVAPETGDYILVSYVKD